MSTTHPDVTSTGADGPVVLTATPPSCPGWRSAR